MSMLNWSELLVKEGSATSTNEIAVTCVACGSSETNLSLRDDTRRIWRCGNCHLLFVFPQPTADQLDEEFQENYFLGTRLETEFESSRRPVLTQIAEEIRSKQRKGKLLDIGCASGELFEYFRDEDWELCGVEPSRRAFERALARFDGEPRVEVINGYVRNVPLNRRFDVITVLESLYYMSDPSRELGNISRLLADDGLLAISLPGPQYQRLRHTGVISKIAHGRPCSLTRSHLFYFSEASLTALLAETGFRIADRVGLVSPKYGGRIGQSIRTTYVKTSRVLSAMTFGQIDLSLHVLYLCRKSATRSHA